MVELVEVQLHRAPRWIRPLALFAVGFVVTTAFQVNPGPGLRGEHLAVSVAVFGLGGATIAMIGLRCTRPANLMALQIAAVVSSAALVGLQPDGPGFLGAFPAVSSAAMRLPTLMSGVVVAIAMVALAVGWIVGGHGAVGIFLNEIGVVAFYLVSMFARRLRESNEEAQRLIVELEETRAAQAQAAALHERQRLAREIHDVLAHTLSGLVLNLEGARLLAGQEESTGEVAAAIERAHRLARTGLDEARRAIGVLRDGELPGPDRMEALVTEFEQDTGVPCRLLVTGDSRELGGDDRLTLYRVAQEALTNVRKHASAERVEVRLEYETAGTRLVIEDFGNGMNAEPGLAGAGAGADGETAGSGGFGLTGMRERAELLGGSLTAQPTDRGFVVELWVPA